MSAFRFIAAAVVVLGLAGCGNSAEVREVKQAVTAWTHAYATRDVKAFCAKTIVATDFPKSLANKMHIPWGEPGTTKGWDGEYRTCVRTYGKHGEFDSKLGGEWKVADVEFGPRDEPQGITRTAHVDIRTKDKRAKVWFVKFRGDWKFVVVGD